MKCSKCRAEMRRGQYDGKPCWACLPCGGIVQIPLGGATTQHSPEKRAKAATTESVSSVFSVAVVEGELDLPYPVSVNALFASIVRHGVPFRIKTREGKEFCKEAGWIASRVFLAPLDGPVSVHILYSPKSGIGMDIDNTVKCCLDALNTICWHDDSQVWKLVVERAVAVPGGRLRVRVKQMLEGAAPAEEAA